MDLMKQFKVDNFSLFINQKFCPYGCNISSESNLVKLDNNFKWD
jgi:hypothetical protein